MKYQFQSSQGPFNYNSSLFTDAIKLLVSINFIIFILQTISSSETVFFPLFGLVPKLVWSDFMLWQPFTYMFFYGGVLHVLINMFVLWMFGGELERLWGKNRFLKFYFYTGIGAGLITMVFNFNSIVPKYGDNGLAYTKAEVYQYEKEYAKRMGMEYFYDLFADQSKNYFKYFFKN